LESLKTAVAGLAATHALWALSLLLDGQRYLLKPVIPPLFAIAHLAVSHSSLPPDTGPTATYLQHLF
jgi:hypothetical protein